MSAGSAPRYEVIVLGSGAGGLAGRRAQSIVLFREEDGRALLIDAGQPLPQRLREADVDPAGIGAVIVTHAHADHFLGLIGLLYELKTVGVKRSPPVYTGWSSASTLSIVLSELSPSGFTTEIEGLSEGREERVELGKIVVETFPVRHSVPTLGVRVLDAARSECLLFYSSDTVYLEKLKELAECSIGLHEATLPVSMESVAEESGFHSSPRQALEVLERSEIRVLTHLTELTFRDPFEARHPYVVAHDGLRLIARGRR
ncbi:MAG: MBL fold metallo-hydrolase [Fervidicoccaceae archaeon]